MYKLTLFVVILLAATNVCLAEEVDFTPGEFWDTPATLSHDQSPPWEITPYILGGTALLYTQDQRIQAWVQENRTPTTDRVASFAKPFGDFSQMAIPLAGIYIYGLIADDRAELAARDTFETMITAGVVTQLLKLITQRPRPSRVEEGDEAFGFFRAGSSFPSGHAAVAFSIATVFASYYDHTGFIPPLAYTMATLTAWSRVNDNAHWASDVFFGAFVGYFAGKAILDTDSDNNITNTSSTLSGIPMGLQFNRSF